MSQGHSLSDVQHWMTRIQQKALQQYKKTGDLGSSLIHHIDTFDQTLAGIPIYTSVKHSCTLQVL